MRQGAQGIEAGRDEVHQRLRPGEHRLEHHEQDRKAGSPGRRADAARRHRAGWSAYRACAAVNREPDDAVSLRWAARRSLGGRKKSSGFPPPAGDCHGQLVEAMQKLISARAADGGGGDDRHAEFGRKLLKINANSAPRAISIMLSTSSSGRPSCLSSITSRKARRNWWRQRRRPAVRAWPRRQNGRGPHRGSLPHPGCARAVNRCPADR